MTKLITNTEIIKSIIIISDNINDKVLQGAIFESQEIDLKSVLGTKLVEYFKSHDESAMEEPFTSLLRELQVYLAYSTQVHLIEAEMAKISNQGIYQANDTNITSLSVDDCLKIKRVYVDKQCAVVKLLQEFCLQHEKELSGFLDGNEWYQSKPNLTSSAATGLWLGGIRGKIII